MRVGFRIVEELFDAIDQMIADRVLHVLGFFMDFVPGELKRLCKKQLDQSMSPQDTQRQIPPTIGQPHTFVRRVLGEATFAQRLEHARDRPRRYA